LNRHFVKEFCATSRGISKSKAAAAPPMMLGGHTFLSHSDKGSVEYGS